jgi:MFS superfamily sulfate permease-like transporter
MSAQEAVQEVIGQHRPAQIVRSRTTNPTCFLNREAVREFLLEQAAGTRAHKFERVSSKTLHQVNESVRQYMIAFVRRLPSKGKTI